jgi:hypothetical protein
MRALKHLTSRSNVLDELTMNDLWDGFKGLVLAAWGRTTRRMRAAGAFLIFLYAFPQPWVTISDFEETDNVLADPSQSTYQYQPSSTSNTPCRRYLWSTTTSDKPPSSTSPKSPS